MNYFPILMVTDARELYPSLLLPLETIFTDKRKSGDFPHHFLASVLFGRS